MTSSQAAPAPQQPGETPGLINARPVRYLGSVDSNNSPASVSDTGGPAARFVLPDSLNSSDRLADWIAALAGVASVNPAPQDDALRGFNHDDPMQPWLAPAPIWRLR